MAEPSAPPAIIIGILVTAETMGIDVSAVSWGFAGGLLSLHFTPRSEPLDIVKVLLLLTAAVVIAAAFTAPLHLALIGNFGITESTPVTKPLALLLGITAERTIPAVIKGAPNMIALAFAGARNFLRYMIKDKGDKQ